MACDCIERKEADLQKDTDDDEAFISVPFDFVLKLRRFSAKAFYRGKILGRYKKNFSIAYIPFDYCPFCGKKYSGEGHNG